MVHWDGMDSGDGVWPGRTEGDIPCLSIRSHMVHWDGMDSGDGVWPRRTEGDIPCLFIPSYGRKVQKGIPKFPVDVRWQCWTTLRDEVDREGDGARRD